MRKSFGLLLSVLVFLLLSQTLRSEIEPVALPESATPYATGTAIFGQQSAPVRTPDTPTSNPGAWAQQGTARRTVDVNQLKAEAKEIQDLSQGLTEQIDKIGNGKLPAELIENLKKIEKISKRIRGEIS
jgi:hypothetical protein